MKHLTLTDSFYISGGNTESASKSCEEKMKEAAHNTLQQVSVGVDALDAKITEIIEKYK